MKYILISVALLLTVGGAVIYRNATSSSTDKQVLAANSAALANDTRIYDVRTEEEFTASHVKTAILFPVTDMQAGKFPDVPKDTPIALYCRTGHRAGQALELMKQAGFTNVKNIGGLSDLAKYGLKAE